MLRPYASENLKCDAIRKRPNCEAAGGRCAVRAGVKQGTRDGRIQYPAQLRLLREYAASKNLVIVQQFVDVETAKRSGRTGFTQMLAYLKTHHGSCRTILAEKTDRLYRNPKDWVALDYLDVEIHFVKENEIASRNSRSSESSCMA